MELSVAVTPRWRAGPGCPRAGQNNANRDKNNKEHHSRLAKLAFWSHHKGADKNAKQAHATRASSKQPQGKTAQIKPASTKAAGKKDQKREQRASNTSRPPVKKTPAANKTKPRQKAEDPKTASLKQ